jgi:hypothetical protein
MEEKIYSWFVKKGNVLIHGNKFHVSLQLNAEDEEYCVLTKSDAEELIDLLTAIATQIWEDTAYVKEVYTKQLYKITEDDSYVWETEGSKLLLRYSEKEQGVTMKSAENTSLNIELNQIVEIIQILELLNNR